MSALNPSFDTLTTADMLIENGYNGRTVLLFGDKHELLVQAYRTAVDKAQEYKAEAFDLSCRCAELEAQLVARKTAPVDEFTFELTCDTSEASAKLDELAAKAERLDATIDTLTAKLFVTPADKHEWLNATPEGDRREVIRVVGELSITRVVDRRPRTDKT